MSYVKCIICGSKVKPLKNPHLGSCQTCLENQFIPITNDGNAILLFNNGRRYMLDSDFENGYIAFTELKQLLPDDCIVDFFIAMCKYGVYYNTNRKRYECKIFNNEPFDQCDEYLKAIELADYDISSMLEKIAHSVDEYRGEKIEKGEHEIDYEGDSRSLKKAYVALENEEWLKAGEYAEEEISINSESGEAFLCKLLAELEIKGLEETIEKDTPPFDHLLSFEYALKYANEATKAELVFYSQRAIKQHKEKIFNSAIYLEDSTSIGGAEKAIELFEEIIDYKDSLQRIERCKKHLKVLEYKYRIYDAMATIFADKGLLSDATLLYQRAEDGKMTRKYLSYLPRPLAASNHTTILQSNGKVLARGENKYRQCDVEKWEDIVSVACSYSHTLGLKKDGTVLATGGTGSQKCDVFDWKNIVAIAAGPGHSVGLKRNGSVIAIGYRHDDRCKVSEWRDIISIKAGDTHTVGLKSDGTVVSVGDNEYGQCDVYDWTDIIALSVGEYHTLGLKRDGTVVATGKNVNGECNVSEWKDIIAIAAGDDHSVGLQNDGTVVSSGSNEFGQCDVSSWGEIICICAGSYHTVGLHPDGSIIATGMEDDGRCDISDIVVHIDSSNDFNELIKQVDNETDIEILKSLAEEKEKEAETILEKILAEEEVENAQRAEAERLKKEASQRKKAENLEKARLSRIQLEERRKAEAILAAERKAEGLCPYCGGTYKGLFNKKCSSCGRAEE